jgi:hypothetical protein
VTGKPAMTGWRPDGICRSCDAPVLWAVTTANGKSQPLDPEPRPDGNLAVHHTATGGYLSRVLKTGEEPEPYERRMQTHFASCPKAGAHRRPRPKRDRFGFPQGLDGTRLHWTPPQPEPLPEGVVDLEAARRRRRRSGRS